jgi:hypothetical protein
VSLDPSAGMSLLDRADLSRVTRDDPVRLLGVRLEMTVPPE